MSAETHVPDYDQASELLGVIRRIDDILRRDDIGNADKIGAIESVIDGAGCAGLSRHFFEFPGVSAGYFAPTYAQIRDIFYPTVEESFQGFGQVANGIPGAVSILV